MNVAQASKTLRQEPTRLPIGSTAFLPFFRSIIRGGPVFRGHVIHVASPLQFHIGCPVPLPLCAPYSAPCVFAFHLHGDLLSRRGDGGGIFFRASGSGRGMDSPFLYHTGSDFTRHAGLPPATWSIPPPGPVFFCPCKYQSRTIEWEIEGLVDSSGFCYNHKCSTAI